MPVASSTVDRLIKLFTRSRWTVGRTCLAAVRPWHVRGALCALIACVFAFPDRVAAQELWRGLELGASANAVREAFPAAARPLAITTLADGETDDLVTNGFFDGDRFLQVRFFFRDGGLTAVMLAPAAIQPNPKLNRLQAERMADELTRRYGQPFDCGDNAHAGVDLYECKWLAKPLVIRLWYMDVLGQAPTLRIVYRKADDAAYDF